MLGAHIYVYTYDAIPIYLPILTYPSYLPTYLIIPSGPLGAISDLHTERRDGFTAWLCTTSIYSSPGRAEPSRTESRHVDFAPFCSYFRKSEERLANSGIAERVAFSLPLTRAPRLLLAPYVVFTGIVALCIPRGTRAKRKRTVAMSAPLRSFVAFFHFSAVLSYHDWS